MPMLMENSKHETAFVVITKDEYESMKETIEVLSDREIAEQIKESTVAKKTGKVRKFEDVAKELGI
jgi:PHD/YefM family antitoxin component YafN of YafNO toxin-antitoxin module